jgi:hypothetical protein
VRLERREKRAGSRGPGRFVRGRQVGKARTAASTQAHWTRRHATCDRALGPWEDDGDGLLPAQTAPDCSDCTDCTIRTGGSHPFRAGKPPTQTAKRGRTTSQPGVTGCGWPVASQRGAGGSLMQPPAGYFGRCRRVSTDETGPPCFCVSATFGPRRHQSLDVQHAHVNGPLGAWAEGRLARSRLPNDLLWPCPATRDRCCCTCACICFCANFCAAIDICAGIASPALMLPC